MRKFSKYTPEQLASLRQETGYNNISTDLQYFADRAQTSQIEFLAYQLQVAYMNYRLADYLGYADGDDIKALISLFKENDDILDCLQSDYIHSRLREALLKAHSHILDLKKEIEEKD